MFILNAVLSNYHCFNHWLTNKLTLDFLFFFPSSMALTVKKNRCNNKKFMLEKNYKTLQRLVRFFSRIEQWWYIISLSYCINTYTASKLSYCAKLYMVQVPTFTFGMRLLVSKLERLCNFTFLTSKPVTLTHGVCLPCTFVHYNS